MSERWYVWHHSCTLHGESQGVPCDPPCDDPWTAQAPGLETGSESFATQAEAIDYATRMAARS